MIRLTLNAQSDPAIHLFNQPTVLIGADSAHVDLVLPGAGIQPIHLKIIQQDHLLILINHANDPFVSVNGHPFGKKLLNSGDVILIDQITILFESLPSSEIEAVIANRAIPLPSLLANKVKKQEGVTQELCALQAENHYGPAHFSLPFEQEVEALPDHEWQKTSLDVYLKDFEISLALEPHFNSPPPQVEQASKREIKEPKVQLDSGSNAKPSSLEHKKSVSLKDDYLRDLEDDNRPKGGPFDYLADSSHLTQAWRLILLFIFSLTAVLGIVGTVIYFSVSDKTEAQETKATQGVADVSMALAYAQLAQLKPHNQNWSDVDFLKGIIQTILPDTPSYASQLDAQGQFNCCPYSLRIYTSTDLTHFVLIAQPAPSVLHWLIPKSIIVVDSNLMELRTLKDVRNLNRLLANSDPLDGLNGKEITQLIKQGKLIRLSTLATESGHLAFAPPKKLAWVRPGAENLIYNAPRYYRLGQALAQKAMVLSTSQAASQEVITLRQTIERLAWLNHFIVYADQGKKSALLTRQAFTLFVPSDKLLFGYLLFNAQGKIHQVHLLKEDEEWKDSPFVQNHSDKESEIAYQSPTEREERVDTRPMRQEEDLKVDPQHPLYIQLQTLVAAREHELKPLASSVFNLINQELQRPHVQFQIEFQNLSHAFLMADAKHKQTIKEALEELYHQYENMPTDHFLAYAKELHLDHLIQQQEDETLTLIDENSQQNIELLLAQIQNSQTLAELDNLIDIASSWLNFDYIKDSNKLIRYQNILRNQLLGQLEKHLLSPQGHVVIKTEDRDILQHLLNQERLIRSEEKDFFLEEFEELLLSQQKIWEDGKPDSVS